MVVLKTGRSMGEVVFIDKGEMDKAPTAVKEALSGDSGPIPKVALSNADGSKVYGTANHTALKNGLAPALKEAKRAMKADVLPGSSGLKPAEPPATKSPSAGDSAPASDSAPAAEIKITEKNGVKDIAGAPLEQWTSSKGTQITARLTRSSGAKITLVTDQGKAITLNQSDLAPDSFKRFQEIIAQ